MLNTRLILTSDTITVAIKELVGRLENPQGLLQDLGASFESRIQARFETQRDPDGKPWQERSPVTLAIYAERAKKGGDIGNNRILDDTGTMLSSLGWEVDTNSVTVGFSAVASKKGDAYAAYHEFGAPKNNMPRCGLIFSDPETAKLSQEDDQMVADLIAEALFGQK